jgi:hypothetical protein
MFRYSFPTNKLVISSLKIKLGKINEEDEEWRIWARP